MRGECSTACRGRLQARVGSCGCLPLTYRTLLHFLSAGANTGEGDAVTLTLGFLFGAGSSCPTPCPPEHAHPPTSVDFMCCVLGRSLSPRALHPTGGDSDTAATTVNTILNGHLLTQV